MTKKFWWADFGADEFIGLDPLKTIAVLPIAAIEQHGPHLPVGTDAILNLGCLEMLRPLVPAHLDVRVLPIQEVGKSNEHLWAQGTLTHDVHSLIDSWVAIGLSVARAGIKKLLFINSHGGNDEVMGIVARELRVRADMLVVKSGWSKFAPPDGLLADAERRHGIHGGDFETSLMLHFRPELVRTEKLANFQSVALRDETEFTHLRPTGNHAYSWISSDLHASGTVGDASKATAEKGRLIAEKEVAGMLELLADIERCRLPAPIMVPSVR